MFTILNDKKLITTWDYFPRNKETSISLWQEDFNNLENIFVSLRHIVSVFNLISPLKIDSDLLENNLIFNAREVNEYDPKSRIKDPVGFNDYLAKKGHPRLQV